MTNNDIPKLRIAAQHLISPSVKKPDEIVSYLGAMQAQDYGMSKWAVGSRTGSTEQEVENAIDNGEIIRTHILRPTWHLVAAKDIRWMLSLTAPHVKKYIIAPIYKQYGLNEKYLQGYNTIIQKALSGNKHFTREEIMAELNIKSTEKLDLRPVLIAMNAELDGIICNGRMRGKQITYALLDERVPNSAQLSKEEALAELAKRYFTSRGPATLQDFTWWSGLSITNSKLAWELVKHAFQSICIDDRTYMFSNEIQIKKQDEDTIHLLPAFDEFLISYKDRTASIPLENQHKAFSKNGIFYPVIVENGKVIGLWKRTIKKDTAIIETQFLTPVNTSFRKSIENAAELYGKFIQKKILLNVTN